MPPKKAQPGPDQPSMLIEHVRASGATDPDMQTYTSTFETVPEGVLPSELPVREIDVPPIIDPKVLHEAIKTDNRRAAQLGKHRLPRKEDGSYDIDYILSNPDEMKGKFYKGRPIRGKADIRDILEDLKEENSSMLGF